MITIGSHRRPAQHEQDDKADERPELASAAATGEAASARRVTTSLVSPLDGKNA